MDRLSTWIEQILSNFQSKEYEKEILRTIRRMNKRRLIIFSIVTTLFECGLIVFYDIPQLMTDMGEHRLSYLYLFLHGSMFVIAISNLIRIKFSGDNGDAKIYENMVYTTIVFGMSAMSGIGILDFITLGQLTSYTTILMACGITLLVRPPYNYIVYGIPQLILTAGLVLVGRQSDILVVTLMNATMFFICVAIITTIHYVNQTNYIRQNLQLTYLSNYDSLTGLINRRFFEQSLTQNMISDSNMSCLVILDIDDFKKVNDKYGHGAGDKVLEYVGSLLSRSVQEKDLAARWGGEEFILLLKDRSLSDCEDIVESMRIDIESMRIPWEDKWIQVTASFGITIIVANAGNYYEEVFKKADAGLYEAKSRGKNQYVINE